MMRVLVGNLEIKTRIVNTLCVRSIKNCTLLQVIPMHCRTERQMRSLNLSLQKIKVVRLRV
jgi:hypothetical protein